MKLTPFKCQHCGSSLGEKDLSLELGVAKCPYCRSVFAIERNASTVVARKPTIKAAVPMPSRFEVFDRGRELEISYRWFSFGIIFLVGFTILWNAFLIGWHSMAITSGAWFMSLFGSLHTAVGIGLAYLCVASVFNRTQIAITSDEMTIHHGPIPWPGNKRLRASDIDQLYCTHQVHHSKNGPRVGYQLRAVMKTGRELVLLKKFEEPQQAFYIEQEVERFLKIKDAPVAGESPR